MPSAKTSEGGKLVAKKQYKEGDNILCKNVDQDGLLYQARIIEVDRSDEMDAVYTVHYIGWNDRHNEVVKHSEAPLRFLDVTAENLHRARKEVSEARANEKKKKKSKIGSGGKGLTPRDEGRKDMTEHTGSSRASTPSMDKVPGSSLASDATVAGCSAKKTKTAMGQMKSPQTVKKAKGPLSLAHKEIDMELPNELKQILVDDNDLINRQTKLVRVPATITALDIVNRYRDAKRHLQHAKKDRATQVELLIESSLGILEYFDASLGTQLLYKFERPQYVDLISTLETQGKSKEQLKMSEYYGFVHLLRLFVRLANMWSYTNWSERSLKQILAHLRDFVCFVNEHRHELFDLERDYETASPEYQKRAWQT